MMTSVLTIEQRLFEAVEKNDIRIVCLLLEEEADVNTRDEGGFTPLQEACRFGHTDITRFLLEKGADVHARDEEPYLAPMYFACARGNAETARLLLEKGADVNTKDRNDNTVIYWACSRGHTDIVRLLIEAGADLNARDSGGKTPLERAMELPPGNKREEILDLFREYAPEQVMEAFCSRVQDPGGGM